MGVINSWSVKAGIKFSLWQVSIRTEVELISDTEFLSGDIDITATVSILKHIEVVGGRLVVSELEYQELLGFGGYAYLLDNIVPKFGGLKADISLRGFVVGGSWDAGSNTYGVRGGIGTTDANIYRRKRRT